MYQSAQEAPLYPPQTSPEPAMDEQIDQRTVSKEHKTMFRSSKCKPD